MSQRIPEETIDRLKALAAAIAEPEPKHDSKAHLCPGCLWQDKRRELETLARLIMPAMLDRLEELEHRCIEAELGFPMGPWWEVSQDRPHPKHWRTS